MTTSIIVTASYLISLQVVQQQPLLKKLLTQTVGTLSRPRFGASILRDLAAGQPNSERSAVPYFRKMSAILLQETFRVEYDTNF